MAQDNLSSLKKKKIKRGKQKKEKEIDRPQVGLANLNHVLKFDEINLGKM